MESISAIYKLIILYMLDRGGSIPMPWISGFLLENGLVDFASLTETYMEIEQNGLVRLEGVGEKTFVSITPEGEETLRFFGGMISDELKKKADAYLKENGRKIRNERAVTGEYYRSSFGGYTVHMEVRENSVPIVSIELNVPDEETAKQTASRWKEQSSDIYGMLIEKLF